MRGSVAEAVVNHATVPVLVVRASEVAERAPRLAESEPTLLVPLDGSEFAEAALPVAQEFATRLGGHIVVVDVLPDPARLVAAEGAVLAYPADSAQAEAEKRAYLTSVVNRLGSAPVETVVCMGGAAAEIAREAQERGAAAVVMATHGRTGLARTILGSVAGAVLHRSVFPVILVRPRELRASEVGAYNMRAVAPLMVG